jgi:hypothetical protein
MAGAPPEALWQAIETINGAVIEMRRSNSRILVLSDKSLIPEKSKLARLKYTTSVIMLFD